MSTRIPSMAARVRRIRQLHQWTQQQMADHVGVRKMTISYWENGTRNPSGTARKIIELLERATPQAAETPAPVKPVRIGYGRGPMKAKAARNAKRLEEAGDPPTASGPTASGEGQIPPTASGEGGELRKTPTASPDPKTEKGDTRK